MIRVEVSEEFMSSLDDALAHPDAPERHAFMASELFAIVDYIRDHWDRLLPGRTDPYRRTLVATYCDQSLSSRRHGGRGHRICR